MNKYQMEKGILIWITGVAASGKTTLAKRVYPAFKVKYPNTVYIDGDDLRDIWENWGIQGTEERRRLAMSYAKLCNFLTNQGINVIISTVALFHNVHDYNRQNNSNYYEILLKTDEEILKKRYEEDTSHNPNKQRWTFPNAEFPKTPDLILENNSEDQIEENTKKILDLINY